MKVLLSLSISLFALTSFASQEFESQLTLAPFVLQWMNHPESNTTYRSSDYPNAVFVIEAYFRRCPACNTNEPNVNSLAAEYAGNENVQFVDVGLDCADSLYREWIAQHNPNHPVLKDCNGSNVLRPLGTRAYPTTYVLDCNLNVVSSHVGVMNSSYKAQLRSRIDTMLASGCQAHN